ncbi:MAG: hypothetical protein AB7F59_05095 [Bdellovibrionales bacterium]
MKFLFLALMAFSFYAEAQRRVSPCSVGNARQAAEVAAQVLLQKHNIGNYKGVTSVGVAACSPKSLALLAGYKVPAVVMPDVCGVLVGFEDRYVANEVAKSIITSVGSRFKTNQGEVRICGRITGRIVPQ